MFNCTICGKRHRPDSAIGKNHYMLMYPREGLAKEVATPMLAGDKVVVQAKLTDYDSNKILCRVPQLPRIIHGIPVRAGASGKQVPVATPERETSWTPVFKTKRMECTSTEGKHAERCMTDREVLEYARGIALASGVKWNKFRERARIQALKKLDKKMTKA